ncbi:DUF2829 domain-containing protein [Escherichia coli]
MNNMATKELFKFLPKYKAHKNVSASKIKNVVIFGVTDAPLWGCIELVEPKGATVCVDAMFLQNEGQYPARMEAIKGYFPGDLVPYGAYFALKNAQGVVVPWVPSVGDLLACDWFVVE